MTSTERQLKPAGFYVNGIHGPSVEIPGRVAAWLERHATLTRIRIAHRGSDPEVDSVLLGLHRVALLWRDSVNGNTPRKPTEEPPPCPWLTTTQAADQLGITDSRIRQDIRAHRLAAEQVDRRWRITREDFEHYKAARAA